MTRRHIDYPYPVETRRISSKLLFVYKIINRHTAPNLRNKFRFNYETECPYSFAVAGELSTPDDKTTLSHDFMAGDSRTVLQIFSVGIRLNVSLILSISPLNVTSATSTI